MIQEALVLKANPVTQSHEEPGTAALTHASGEEEPTAVLEVDDKGLVAPPGRRAAQGGREE